MASPALPRLVYRSLLKALLEQNGWLSWGRFEGLYADAAKRVAARLGGTPVSVSRSTYMRWIAGESTPEGLAQQVLEELFGIGFELLMGPAPDREIELPGVLKVTSRAAAMLVDSKWSTSMLYPTTPVAGVDGSWHLDGVWICWTPRQWRSRCTRPLITPMTTLSRSGQPTIRTFGSSSGQPGVRCSWPQ
ncbi:hypothetical protein [Streptomyces sp. SAI-090]|uniref:hypothetical protein n=1 Tax=Streptomyces sp. SAI-090 TaxID=2940545 RepID=UPI0024734F09|nr:hypothetical protein [Streptomyces sp. SAI-090]MDH6522373.1 transcriptional regulator with XRE-family HTH domain [Streptomyces sp. SAI-090]